MAPLSLLDQCVLDDASRIIPYKIALLGGPICSNNIDLAGIAGADPPVPTIVSFEMRSSHVFFESAF